MINNMAIVGAGIAGIYAAILSKTLRPDLNVVLIEQSDVIGGLLASKTFDGYEFDYGTHVPRMTGHEIVDSILFGDLDKSQWRQFQNINAGNVSLNKVLYTRSANPYLGKYSNPDFGEHLAKLFDAIDTQKVPYTNLQEQLEGEFGKGFVRSFFAPSISKKLGAQLKDLAPDTHKLLGLARIIVGESETMKVLKSHPRLDDVLAYADQTDGMSDLINMYPSNGRGIGLWLEQLEAKMRELGVIIKTNCQLTELMRDGRDVHHIWLSDGSEYAIDHLCWCSPAFALIRAAQIPFESQYKPSIRQTKLYHFAFKQPLEVDNNYIDVNDPSFNCFRVTLYPNLGAHKHGPYKLTVEVMEPENCECSVSEECILQELIKMGVVSDNNECLYSNQDLVKAGFPVITPEFKNEVARQQSIIHQQLGNVSTLGKASGKYFFMQEVLIAAHTEVSELFSSKANESMVDTLRDKKPAVTLGNNLSNKSNNKTNNESNKVRSKAQH